MPVPAAGWVMIIAVVLIVATIVVYLLSTILALRKITAGLDESNQIERATCRGAGQLYNYAPESDSKQARNSRPVG